MSFLPSLVQLVDVRPCHLVVGQMTDDRCKKLKVGAIPLILYRQFIERWMEIGKPARESIHIKQLRGKNEKVDDICKTCEKVVPS